MRMTKGTYKILTQLGWKYKEGTVGYDYPFYVFREAEHKGSKDWCLSHMSSGYSIKKNISLRHARQLIECLKPYPLFLLPDADSIAKEQNRMSKWRRAMIQNIVNQEEKP